MNKSRFYIIAYVSHGANDLYWFILPLVLPYLLKRFSLPYASGGAILTGYMLVVALFSFLLGRFSDRVVRWKMMALGFLIASLGFIFLSLISFSLELRLTLFITVLMVTAVGVSAFHPTMYALLDEHTPSDRGKVFGRYEMWGTAAILCMYLLNGFLFDYIGWQGALITTAIPGFAMVILLPVFRNLLEPVSQTVGVRGEKKIEEESGKKRSGSQIILFLISAMLRILGAIAVLNFLPTYFSLELSMLPAISSYFSGFFFLGGIVAGFLFGRISEKKGPFVIMLIFSALVGVSIIILSLITIPWLLPVVTFVYGFVVSTCVPAQNLILTSLSTRAGRGETFGIMMGVLTLTNSLSPLLLGLVADAVGLGTAIGLFSIPAFVGWFIYLILFIKLRKPLH